MESEPPVNGDTPETPNTPDMGSEPPVNGDTPETPNTPDNPNPNSEEHTAVRNTVIIVVVLVVVIAVVLVLFFGLRACNNDEPDEVNPDPDIVEPGPVDPNPDGDDDGETGHTEHTWVWEYDEEGHWQVCEVCGETTTKEDHELTYTEEDSTYHLVTCDICGYEATDEHTWVETSNTPATCTTSGAAYYKCEFCKATKTEAIEPLGHDPSSDWSSDANGHWHACLRCDENLDYAAHALVYKDNGNGTHTQYCSVCNYEIKTESHDIEYTQISGNDTCHTESCKYCDYTATVAHTFDGYTSWGDRGHCYECTKCEYTTTVISHNLYCISDNESGHYWQCSECTYYTYDEPHTFNEYTSVDDTDHKKTCSECGYETQEEHDYELTDTSAVDIPSAKVTNTYTCTECDHTKEEQVDYEFDFATDSWDIIDQVCTAGYASTYYNVGDVRENVSINGESHTVRIIDFDHDDLSSEGVGAYNGGSGKAAMTVEMATSLPSTYSMNQDGTNAGGWAECYARTYTLPTIYNTTLEESLKSVIKPVIKYGMVGGGSYSSPKTTVSSTIDTLFLLSEGEISGENSEGFYDEGTQYKYWEEHSELSDRTKYNSKHTANVGWWTRTAYPNSSTSFRYVSTPNNAFVTGYATNSLGLSFAFCI